MRVWRARGAVRAIVGVGLLVLVSGLGQRGPIAVAPRSAHAAAGAHARQAAGTAAVIADPGDTTLGSPTTFDGSGSSGGGLTYAWDFGDGTTASGIRVQHGYARVDDYTVTLTVQDGTGATNSVTRTVRVVPAVQSLTGMPALVQIVPASAFTADLAIDAAGPPQVSVQIGGNYLSSQRWDYVGGNTPTLLEIPQVTVANEDNAEIAARIIDVPGGSISLQNNVDVTVSYPVSNGGRESVDYTMSLLKPPDAGTAASSVTSQGGPPSGAGAAASPTPSAGSTRYLQASASPAPSPIASLSPAASPAPQAVTTATPAPAVAATPTPPAASPPAQPAAWSITYPSYLPIVGLPVPDDDVNNYYLTGDRQFHHVDDPLVRRFAIKIARAGGIFPDDPKRAADNIYNYVHGLLGIGDPGELQDDLVILQRVENGILVPGARDGEYICIAHAYFLSSLTRTLGLPDREETIAFGRGVAQDSTGAWIMNYYQEGANEVWYGGAWHHYDTWIGTTDRADYLDTNLTEVAWYAFSEQDTPFTDVNGNPVGLAGHDFSLGKYTGTPGSPDQWRFLEQQTRPGIRISPPGPDAYDSGSGAPFVPAETVSPGIVNAGPANSAQP
ncbi:MAG TPA: PKD domain-containing protein [Dehalococcoidia bacterium]|nr:PKD domain-containing protein [Dehalococcoidia bacterium]